MFSKILLPLDRSSLAEQAIGPAASIARGSHAVIDVVLVHEPFPFAGYTDIPWDGQDEKAENKYVDAIAAELKSGANVSSTFAVMRGPPPERICQRVRDTGANLIVMTSHGRTGFSRAWLGSVADAVMRNSAVPVLMLRPERGLTRRGMTEKSIKRILVPLDSSPLANVVIPAAIALAHATHATISIVRVVPIVPIITPIDATMPITNFPLIPDAVATQQLVDETVKQVEEVARRLQEDGGVSVDAHVVVSEHVANAIVDFAATHNVDVIAMSTHGRGASRWVMGSVADKVLRASSLPILLQRPVSVVADPVLIDAGEIAQQLPALAFG